MSKKNAPQKCPPVVVGKRRRQKSYTGTMARLRVMEESIACPFDGSS